MQKKQRQAQGKICAALGAQQVREGTMDVTDMGVWGPLHRSYSRAVVIPGCSWDHSFRARLCRASPSALDRPCLSPKSKLVPPEQLIFHMQAHGRDGEHPRPADREERSRETHRFAEPQAACHRSDSKSSVPAPLHHSFHLLPRGPGEGCATISPDLLKQSKTSQLMASNFPCLVVFLVLLPG